MKHVFPTDEIPHLWAHKTQSEARNPQRNLFFANETIYSYRESFPIARHVTNAKGENAILFTTATYSVTTSKHLSMVRQAMPHNTTVFKVPSFDASSLYESNHRNNMAHFVQESEQALRKATKSRKYSTQLLNEAFGYRETAKAYGKFFKIKVPSFSFLPTSKTLDGLKEQFKARDAKQAKREAIANKKRIAAYAERDRIAALKAEERLQLWLEGADVSTWQLNGTETALRIVGNEVETSRGAKVPIAHAIHALAMVRKVIARGVEFVTNGHTIHVGHYKLDRITTDGTVYAGCHVIKLAAIERIASQLDSTALTLNTIAYMKEL